MDAIGIVRASRMNTVRPKTNAERVSAWRERSGRPGFAGAYVVPHRRTPIKSMPDIETARRVLANPAAADAAHRPTGDPSYAARGTDSPPRNYSEERK
ncbi:MAG TPA: hypothetical protein VFP92_10650 [Rhodanobacteraceae bacterium]|nr:hypothetical protein [Rhodanobacteraceae bacterium]